MKQTVYIETSIVSYLASRPSRDLLVAAHQQATHDWWHKRRSDFDLVISDLVLREAGAGDKGAAAERLRFLSGLRQVPALPSALALARRLLVDGALPKKAADDAFHVAIAATSKAEFLLTWNMKHIANASMRTRINQACRETGFQPPIICTPYELQEK